MKKSISKKILSLFLAVMMLATSIPFAVFTASAAEPAKAGEQYKYVFAYFTATSLEGQRVNIAVSSDGLNYTRMAYFNGNGSTGVMKQSGSLGKRYNSPSARDPYIFDGKDGYYYVIATDADCSIQDSPYWDNSRSFVLWRSKDLINWGEEKLINMEVVADDTVYRAWAPQVYVCNAEEMALNGGYKYMIYFAMASANTTGSRTDMYCSFATDLYRQETWTKPQLMYKPCDDVQPGAIDGDIVKIGNEYIMYVKDEDIANNNTGTQKTYWVSASTPWGPYENQKYDDSRVIGSIVCEGANSFYIGSDLYMIVDSNASQAASSDNMKLLKATDATGKNFTDVTSSTNIPSLTPKHGSILAIPVTDSTAASTANAYEVTGNVTIDNPVVYTHGYYQNQYTHPYAYMNYGGYISDASFDGEYDAPTYKLNNGAQLTGVYVEGSNNIIGFEGGKLTGYLGSAYDATDGTAPTTVTLVFKFANGTYEKHTLAVKTNPVAQHAVGSTFSIQDGTLKSGVAFEVLAQGSIGSTSSSGSYSSSNVQQGGSRNFPAMYVPYDSYYNSQMTNSGTAATVYIGGLSGDTITVGKTVGYYAASGLYCTFFKGYSEVMTVNSPMATYYLDTSTSSNKGITYNAADKSYSFDLLFGNLSLNKSPQNTSVSRTASSVTGGLSIITDAPSSWTNTSMSSGNIKIGGSNPSGNVTGTYTLTYFNDNGSCDSTTTINMPFQIIVSDKSALRSVYNQYVSEYKIEKCYTDASWDAYVLALRAAENYLGNPENTDTTEMASRLTALRTAYNALTPLTDIAPHQSPDALSDVTKVSTTEPTCNSTGYDTYKCNLCGQEFEINPTATQPHTYKYVTDTFDNATFSCEWIDLNNCGKTFSNSIDFQVYSALDMVYNTIDHSKYTADGDQALKAAYAEFAALKEQEFVENENVESDIYTAINAATAQLLIAINTANEEETVNGFNVTFKVVVDGKETYSKVIPGKYGDIVSLDASEHTNGLTCSTWQVSVDDSEYANGYVKNIGNASNTYDVLVQADTTVIAYASAETLDNCIPVTINDQYGNALYSINAPADTTVSFESVNKIKIGEMTYEVPNMPFYIIKTWLANSREIATDAATTVTALANGKDSIVLTPRYDKPEDEYNTIKLNGNDVAFKAYDELCTINVDASAYGIAIKNADGSYSVVSYSNSYKFYANRDMEFYTIVKVLNLYSMGDLVVDSTKKEDKLLAHQLENKLPFVYSAPAETVPGKFTTFNAFSTNAGNNNDLKIVEVGTLYAKDVDDSAMVVGGKGVYTAVSKNQIDFSNQYSLSLGNSVGIGVKTRAYVKYSYTYGGETIEAIAYGNICTL